VRTLAFSAPHRRFLCCLFSCQRAFCKIFSVETHSSLETGAVLDDALTMNDCTDSGGCLCEEVTPWHRLPPTTGPAMKNNSSKMFLPPILIFPLLPWILSLQVSPVGMRLATCLFTSRTWGWRKGSTEEFKSTRLSNPGWPGKANCLAARLSSKSFCMMGNPSEQKLQSSQWEKTLPRSISSQDHDERFDLQLIQWTIDLSHQAMIGGDVNAVVLDRKGIRWPAQKQYFRH
jgi:hypothetical protein